MHPLKKIVTGLAFATAGLLPLSAGAVTAPSMADAHTNRIGRTRLLALFRHDYRD